MRELSPEDAAALINRVQRLEVWDTRTRTRWTESHIAGSRCVPLEELVPNLEGCGCFAKVSTPRDTPILVYGEPEAAEVLERNGFSEVYVLAGGLAAWRGAGLPYSVPYATGYVTRTD
jgi:rhodanese-related sulfurtransferase